MTCSTMIHNLVSKDHAIRRHWRLPYCYMDGHSRWTPREKLRYPRIGVTVSWTFLIMNTGPNDYVGQRVSTHAGKQEPQSLLAIVKRMVRAGLETQFSAHDHTSSSSVVSFTQCSPTCSPQSQSTDWAFTWPYCRDQWKARVTSRNAEWTCIIRTGQAIQTGHWQD